MSNRATIAALALLVLIAACACLGAFVSYALNSAISQADVLATETTDASTATSDAHAVSVCVGLFNIGACSPRQTSSSTATARPAVAADDDLGPSPWPWIIPASVALLVAVYGILRGLTWLDGAR